MMFQSQLKGYIILNCDFANVSKNNTNKQVELFKEM